MMSQVRALLEEPKKKLIQNVSVFLSDPFGDGVKNGHLTPVGTGLIREKLKIKYLTSNFLFIIKFIFTILIILLYNKKK